MISFSRTLVRLRYRSLRPINARHSFCTLTPYDLKRGLIVFNNGRYVEILKAAPSTNKKLKSMYKLEVLDLFTNAIDKEYFSYGQIEKFDVVDTRRLDVEFQYFDEDRKLLIVSDEVYNQHEIPVYLFRGHIASMKPGSRLSLLLDGDRYIKMI